MSLGNNDNYLILEFIKLKDEIASLHADVRNCHTAIRVKDEENARLKAECQARQAENSVLAVECDSLKEQVERLTKVEDKMIEVTYIKGIAGINKGVQS